MSGTLDLGDNLLEEPVNAGRISDEVRPDAVTRSPAKKPKRVRILLEDNDTIPPTGQFIGHNGKGYILRPNEECEVPAELLAVLDDAVEDAPIIGPDTRVVGWRKRKRFPYRIINVIE